MSSEVTYSAKNYRNNWLSQFGLYRYESASQKRQGYTKKNKIFLRIISLLAAILLVVFTVFFITNNISHYDESERIIFLSKLESEPSHSFQLTTVFYPDDQIASYRRTVINTTPMTNIKYNRSEKFHQNAEDADNTSAEETSLPLISKERLFYPISQRRSFANVLRPRIDFENESNVERPSGFKTRSNHLTPQMKIVFSDHDLDSTKNVNNIRDILEQVSNSGVDAGDSIYAQSIPLARGVRIEGTYRRQKKRDRYETLDMLQSGKNSQRVTDFDQNPHKRAKDPFSKFKPASPSEVNLLALNQFRFAPYTNHNPHQLAAPSILHDYQLNMPPNIIPVMPNQDPQSIYHQIIAANNNWNKKSRTSRNEHLGKKHKPFSLMLDVYPVPDEEATHISTTRITPFNQPVRPFYPLNVNAINHNLQYASDNSYYNHIKFPQLQQYRSPLEMAHYHNNMYFRNFMANQENQFRSTVKPASANTFELQNDETPSKITVHLNLFPNRKKTKSKNVQIIEENGYRNDQLHKRMENLSHSEKHPSQNSFTSSYYSNSNEDSIPPFSARNVNTLLNETNAAIRPFSKESFGYDSIPSESIATHKNEFHEIRIPPTSLNSIKFPTIDESTISMATIATPTAAPTMSSSLYATSNFSNQRHLSQKIPFLPTPLNVTMDDDETTITTMTNYADSFDDDYHKQLVQFPSD